MKRITKVVKALSDKKKSNLLEITPLVKRLCMEIP